MNPTVVVATDDPRVINPLSQVLMKRDWCILITKSKLHSILNILDKEITFFILDFELPENSNLELISIIRAIRPRLPIIVLSEDISIHIRKKLAQIGVFYHALKPLHISELEQIVAGIEKLTQEDGINELVN